MKRVGEAYCDTSRILQHVATLQVDADNELNTNSTGRQFRIGEFHKLLARSDFVRGLLYCFVPICDELQCFLAINKFRRTFPPLKLRK
jgi:hypothetical protein